jgi:hypothetical protein
MVNRIKRLKNSYLHSFVTFTIVIFLLLTLNLIGSSSLGITQEDENDNSDDNDRSLHLEVEEEQVEIESRLSNGTIKDEIAIHFKVSNEPEFEIGYKSESESVEQELEFSIKFQSLIEFLDVNNNSAFDQTTDQLIQQLDLDLDYQALSHYILSIGAEKIVHIINTTSLNGIFSLQFYVVESISKIHGAVIVPSQIKLDIGINNFIFSEDTSKLALNIKLSAENEYEHNEETEDEHEGRSNNEQEVKVSMNNHTGFFSWSEYAQIDGINLSVKSSDIEDGGNEEQEIFLTYNQGQRIIHDPKIGIIGIIISPIIPSEIISNIVSLLVLAKEEYLLSLIVFTTIIVSFGWILQKRNLGQNN